MKFTPTLTDAASLAELGHRLARVRLDRQWTQAALAKQAGVSKRTVERLEAGGSTQTQNLIRVWRALGLLENLEALVGEAGPRPMELLTLKHPRRRASSPRKPDAQTTPQKWTWEDDA